MSYRKNLAAGVSLALFAVIYLYFSSNISTFTGSGSTPLGARFMPRFWGLCLLLLSTILAFRGLAERRMQLTAAGIKNSPFSLTALLRNRYEVILTFAAICVYIFFLKSIGFIIMTTLYLFAQILILSSPKEKKHTAAAVTAIVFAVGLDYIFVVLLNVLLPKGIIGF